MTSVLTLALATVTGAILLRQLVILGAIVRSATFLRRPAADEAGGSAPPTPTYFVVLPVLRETTVIAEAIAHFETVVRGHAAQLIVVTTARERNEPDQHTAPDTVTAVEQITAGSKVVHLHYPQPAGLKGDQLNFAAHYCADTLLGDIPARQAYLVCYDADSRPPLDCLEHFAQAAAAQPAADVFHQSARFEVRPRQLANLRDEARLVRGLAEAAALRANRFVLGFEIPRLLNRSAAAGPLKRRLCSPVYAHVTGHGLCIRLSLLIRLPFPARSPLEDMHYSFLLGSHGVTMVPVPSLDRSEVPVCVRAQVDQAARWFFGPARFARYLRDPATRRGWRSSVMAASALGSAMEWLGCAIVPAGMALLLAIGSGVVRWLAAAVVLTYLAQLACTDAAAGAPARPSVRLVRVAACPAATTLFGVGGFIGLVRLMRGGSGVGKTERR